MQVQLALEDQRRLEEESRNLKKLQQVNMKPRKIQKVVQTFA